jgi:hypothetical protein
LGGKDDERVGFAHLMESHEWFDVDDFLNTTRYSTARVASTLSRVVNSIGKFHRYSQPTVNVDTTFYFVPLLELGSATREERYKVMPTMYF